MKLNDLLCCSILSSHAFSMEPSPSNLMKPSEYEQIMIKNQQIRNARLLIFDKKQTEPISKEKASNTIYDSFGQPDNVIQEEQNLLNLYTKTDSIMNDEKIEFSNDIEMDTKRNKLPTTLNHEIQESNIANGSGPLNTIYSFLSLTEISNLYRVIDLSNPRKVSFMEKLFKEFNHPFLYQVYNSMNFVDVATFLKHNQDTDTAIDYDARQFLYRFNQFMNHAFKKYEKNHALTQELLEVFIYEIGQSDETFNKLILDKNFNMFFRDHANQLTEKQENKLNETVDGLQAWNDAESNSEEDW